ncbi:uncharacterized protein [Hyperolius riggenbachi]|uniref:uncharacterized protein n=1 Tax=Hyperolius riggenbachi TaxID=752182 RepID=UPI0035A29C49
MARAGDRAKGEPLPERVACASSAEASRELWLILRTQRLRALHPCRSFQSAQWIIRPLACKLYIDMDIEDREISDSDSSDFENGGYLDSLERDELYLATRLASALFIRDILLEPSVEIGLAIVQNRLTRDHGPMPSYEDMENPTTENLWGIITAVAADIIFGMEMHPVPPLTDDEEDAWMKVVKRIRDNYTEDPICVQPPPPAAEEIQPPAAEEIQPPAAEEIQPPAAEEIQPPAAEEIQPPAAEEIQPPAAEEIQPPAAEEIQPPAAEDRPPTPGPSEGPPPEDPPAEPTPAPRRTLRARLARAWRRVRGFLTCSANRTA